MSGMDHGSKAGMAVSAVAAKPRSALSKEERRFVAATHGVEQAKLVVERQRAALQASTDKLKELEAGVNKAVQEFEAAKAALEGK